MHHLISLKNCVRFVMKYVHLIFEMMSLDRLFLQKGVAFIVDEVQTGVGATGHMWCVCLSLCVCVCIVCACVCLCLCLCLCCVYMCVCLSVYVCLCMCIYVYA